MYKWANERKFSTPRSFSAFNFTPKTFNNLIKVSFESISYNQLPVIKEEEGYISENENESQSPENLLFKKKYTKKKTLHMGDSKDNIENHERIKEAKTFTKLPPLVNVNCLMNTDIKQSHHIWDTNFGKRLINGRNNNLVDHMSSSGAKEDDTTKNRHSEKSASQPSKFSSIRKSVAEQNVKNGGGDTAVATAQKKISRKKPKKITKTNQNLSKKFCQKKESLNDNVRANEAKSSLKIIQTSSKEKLEKTLSRQISKAPSSKEETVEVTPTASSFSKNRHFLTECVRSILDSTQDQHECEHCKEHFSNIEELCQHKKQHELKKEICLLCEKVFYNPNEFIQHLLSHEGVDKFSCKKCKKYFPNLKKYKQHCQDFHSVTEKTSNYHVSQTSLEYVKKWLPQYKCKRCKIDFDSEKAQEEHKRNHIKTDLAGAYLLSPKNL